jgi:hypothetical protein
MLCFYVQYNWTFVIRRWYQLMETHTPTFSVGNCSLLHGATALTDNVQIEMGADGRLSSGRITARFLFRLIDTIYRVS